MKLIPLILLLALGFGMYSCSGPSIVSERSESVVRIFNLSSNQAGHGSGFVIGKKGEIATNHHVIEGARRLRVGILVDGKIHLSEASVKWSDEGRDLAVVVPENKLPCPRLKLNTRIPQSGDEVFSIGYPGAADTPDSETKEIIQDVLFGDNELIENPTAKQENLFISSSSSTAVRRVVEQSWSGQTGINVPMVTLIESDANISGGNSGGPLFNSRGEVIGVNTAIRLGRGGFAFSSAIEELVGEFKNDSTLKGLNVSLATTSLPIFSVIPIVLGGIIFLLFAMILLLLFALRRPKVLQPVANHSRIVSKVVHQIENRNLKNQGRDPVGDRGGYIRGQDGQVVAAGSNQQESRRTAQATAVQEPKSNKFAAVTITATLPDGTQTRHVVRKSSASVMMGRSRSCDFAISEPSISKQHALFFFGDGHLGIKDLGSANGTKINGYKLSGSERKRLRDGDVIKLGTVSVKIDCEYQS